ncbi:MAG TPA: cytochrome c biogenesis protein CcsA [Bryobacteraceae bacterium]|nr:cytochrome c biogenesis protein CcsA [Bryobacteraceae bacterium]
MRFFIAYLCAAVGGLLLVRNLYLIFLVLPDESSQGPVYRILFFHVPAWWTAFLAVTVAAIASILYLIRRNLRWDSIAVAATEVGLVFLLVGITLGSIWGRVAWGIWWTWDARLTSALICILLYAAYLAVRRNIDDPTQRARIAAVASLFAFCDVPIVWYSIRWWRTQHPQPMELPPDMMSVLLQNWLAIVLIVVALVIVRFEQEEAHRRIAALRFARHEVNA